MPREEKRVRVPEPMYRLLCGVLDRYTRYPVHRRPEMRTITLRVMVINNQSVFNNFWVTPVHKYHHGAREDLGKELTPLYYLTAKSIAVVEWWIELGYDWQALERNEEPPNTWLEAWDTDDLILHYSDYKPKGFPNPGPDSTTPGEVEIRVKSLSER